MNKSGFSWNTQNYIQEVENGSDLGLQEYQKQEIEYITTKIRNPNQKTFIDVGAGYGRILPYLAKIAKKVIAIELDENLHEELQKRASQFPNCIVLMKNGNDLSNLLPPDLENPVILSMQNTLGSWVGDRNLAITEMRKVAEPKHREIIVSLFCREAIKDWGIPMYATVERLLGRYDPSASDLENGIYKTDTGYESYWFSTEEREEIKKKLGGNIIGEILDHKFHIFHISYI